MSVEGLLSEVSTILGSRLTIRAADQAFFGDQQVHTNVPLATTSSGHCGGKKDELTSAIHNAQNIIDKALAGQSVGADVNSEIAALKRENQEIKKEVAELRKLIQDLTTKCSSRLRFADSSRILILGDGNLSFSLAIARMFHGKRITATVLEDEDLFRQRFPQEVVDDIRRLPNVDLHFSIDATKLPVYWHGLHDTIIMNFPHPGGKTNLKRSRQLAKGIFQSLRTIMTDETEFHLSLAVGQSGIPDASKWSTSPPAHYSDSWTILAIAAEEGFLLREVMSFYPLLFPGYQSAGYKSTAKGFNNYTAPQRLVFVKSRPDVSFDDLRLATKEYPRMFNLYRPYFIRDISFLFNCREIEIPAQEEALLNVLEEILASLAVKIEEIENLRAICPDPRLPNRIYRIFYQSDLVPLTRTFCNQLDEILRQRIVKIIEEKKLPLILT